MKTTVYIPMQPESQRVALERQFLARFGGFTTMQGLGNWVMPDGTNCHEPVEIVDIYTPSTDRPANESFFFEACRQYGLSAMQDAVLIVHDNEPVFIQTKAAA